jgi:hypothetical protein
MIERIGMIIRGKWILVVAAMVGLAQTMAFAGAETLLVVEPNKAQTRNSEGDIVRLRDGRLCLVYTRFTGGRRDHSTADLAMRTSDDNGRTWGRDKILLANEGKCNVMSVSIVRLKDNELLLFYLRKDERLRSCSTYVRRSAASTA